MCALLALLCGVRKRLLAVLCALFLPEKMQLHTKFRTARECLSAEAARRRRGPASRRVWNLWVSQTALVRARQQGWRSV
jgi:hypothetical protein